MKAEILFGRKNVPVVISAVDRYPIEIAEITLREGTEYVEFYGPSIIYMEELERRKSGDPQAYYEISITMPDGSLGHAFEAMIAEATLSSAEDMPVYRGTVSKPGNPQALEHLYNEIPGSSTY